MVNGYIEPDGDDRVPPTGAQKNAVDATERVPPKTAVVEGHASSWAA